MIINKMAYAVDKNGIQVEMKCFTFFEDEMHCFHNVYENKEKTFMRSDDINRLLENNNIEIPPHFKRSSVYSDRQRDYDDDDTPREEDNYYLQYQKYIEFISECGGDELYNCVDEEGVKVSRFCYKSNPCKHTVTIDGQDRIMSRPEIFTLLKQKDIFVPDHFYNFKPNYWYGRDGLE